MNLSVDRANIGAGPAQRPDQLRDPNLPAASGRRNAGSTRRPSRCRRRSRSAARRATASSARASPTSISSLAKTWALGGTSQLEFRWEVFNLLNRANFDLPNRIFGTPNFGRIFSAKNPAGDAVGREVEFLVSR